MSHSEKHVYASGTHTSRYNSRNGGLASKKNRIKPKNKKKRTQIFTFYKQAVNEGKHTNKRDKEEHNFLFIV